MLGVKACMHVAYVFQELNINLHGVQLALHKKLNKNKGSKKISAKTSTDVGKF